MISKSLHHQLRLSDRQPLVGELMIFQLVITCVSKKIFGNRAA